MKLQFQAAGRRCSSNLCPILHSSDALISASHVASSIPRLWLLTSSQDSPQLQVHLREYVCSTCVDALNRLWTKILPVVNAATCAQVHVQIVFCSTCSMMVQLCGVPLFPAPFTMQGTIDGCFKTPCVRRARARFAWSPFFFGAASAALRRGAGPRSPRSFSPGLQAGRRS